MDNSTSNSPTPPGGNPPASSNPSASPSTPSPPPTPASPPAAASPSSPAPDLLATSPSASPSPNPQVSPPGSTPSPSPSPPTSPPHPPSHPPTTPSPSAPPALVTPSSSPGQPSPSQPPSPSGPDFGNQPANFTPTASPAPPPSTPSSTGFRPVLAIVIFFIFALIGGGVYLAINPSLVSSIPFISSLLPSSTPSPTPTLSPETTSASAAQLQPFADAQEFTAYLSSAESDTGYYGLSLFNQAMPQAFEGADLGIPSAGLRAPSSQTESSSPDRVSQTNVQVPGIDEPDIVKTDGQSLFYSRGQNIYPLPFGAPLVMEEQTESKIMPPQDSAQTQVVKAWPPTELSALTSISQSGNLLLQDNVLIIFSGDHLIAYDVSQPTGPTQKWTFDLDSQQTQVAARLYQNRIYLVTRTQVSSSRPCPLPLTTETQNITIPCNQIYHPPVPIPVDSTFTVSTIDFQSGELNQQISFVGTQATSVVYMSPDALFITYTYYQNLFSLYSDFFSAQGQDLISQTILDRLAKLSQYDISVQAKLVEFQSLWQNYLNALDQDERRRIENEFANRFSDYLKANVRDLEKSGIVKISASDLSVQATGLIPGQPLNQFSLDQYQDHLRIATTTASMFGAGESVNDIYVLDSNLNISGKITDLGLTERIYSARFIQDQGYLVTFRQTDPFYVLNLSDPTNPQKVGELKIPGYSSYLHPISDDRILGVGKEGSQVKLSLFNVSDPANPAEAAKYLLDESWTDVLNTHHAFLLDSDHSIFFLPGSRGGYIFSYANDQLQLARVVSDVQAQRALYLNDYLYVVGRDKLVILNQQDWQSVNQLVF
jgi:inhibitor of cysteine peptidase